MRAIRKAAVMGSGVMGGGIAAQVANAGVPVALFDVTKSVAAAALERLGTGEAFMLPANARLVTPLGIDDGLAALADCDWIVEAIVESVEAKRDLYAKIEKHRKPGAVLSSNTSTIPLAVLTKAMPQTARAEFLITHFFNPPRHMRLLEIVAGPATSGEAAAAVARFADVDLGKTVVRCRDRPGFVANRLGCFWMQAAVAAAFAQGISVEEADAVMGKPFGIPKTGVFGLLDLVGIDLMPKVNASLAAALDMDDPFHRVNVPLTFVDAMIARGLIGRKGKGGFYRIDRDRGKIKEAIDLASGEYRALCEVDVGDHRDLLVRDDRFGRYARAVVVPTLAYAAMLIGDAVDDAQSIDAAMRLGYNWKWGPFALIDRIGVAKFLALATEAGLAPPPILAKAEGRPFYRNGEVLDPGGDYVPVARPAGVLRLEDFKRKTAPRLANSSATLWDVGDGVACFEIATKMNAIDADALSLLGEAIDVAGREFKGLVVYSDAAHFSVGANLRMVLFAINLASWETVADLVRLGQQAFKRLKYAPFPSVGAPAGLALGGGCEILLHCSAVQAHAETYIGLVETGVGLIPGWGGTGELLLRIQMNTAMPKGPMPAILRAFETIAAAAVSKSAAHAREMMVLRREDGITMNRDRLLADAKDRVLAMAAGYKPPPEPHFALPGAAAQTAMTLLAEALHRQGKATAYDLVVARALAEVLGGDGDVTRPLSEAHLLDIERAAFMDLVRRPETLARIEHTLATGKPLRN